MIRNNITHAIPTKDAISVMIGPSSYPLTQTQSQALFELIAANSKDEAIKLLSKITGADLETSKIAVEDLEDNFKSKNDVISEEGIVS